MSTSRLESCVPLPLEDDVLEEIVNKARDWALMHVDPPRQGRDSTGTPRHWLAPRRENCAASRMRSVGRVRKLRVRHTFEGARNVRATPYPSPPHWLPCLEST
uniref:Uncharacterized protein n=1 Tax=Timema douglasi TaxID=61478 RepID=A0A7R8VZG3_TIMDO|nr:unnamed protein product [Timema douglasi]